MSDKLTLGWMDKIREMKKKNMVAGAILRDLMLYGESEEERISERFAKKMEDVENE